MCLTGGRRKVGYKEGKTIVYVMGGKKEKRNQRPIGRKETIVYLEECSCKVRNRCLTREK
jgi:hypothetical protein